MVRNSIKAVLAEKGVEYCSESSFRLTVVDFGDGTNLTCNDLNVQIAVSLAFTSGLIMVSCCHSFLYNCPCVCTC